MAFIQDRFKLSLEALSEAVLGRLGGLLELLGRRFGAT